MEKESASGGTYSKMYFFVFTVTVAPHVIYTSKPICISLNPIVTFCPQTPGATPSTQWNDQAK